MGQVERSVCGGSEPQPAALASSVLNSGMLGPSAFLCACHTSVLLCFAAALCCTLCCVQSSAFESGRENAWEVTSACVAALCNECWLPHAPWARQCADAHAHAQCHLCLGQAVRVTGWCQGNHLMPPAGVLRFGGVYQCMWS